MANNNGMGMLQNLALGLVITAILVVVSLNILETLQGQQTADGYAYNATTTTIQAIDDIPDWFAIIVIVVVGVVIFALLRLFGASV